MRHHHPFRRKRLQRRLFVWFGVSILFTLISVALVLHLLPARDTGWSGAAERLRRFAGHQLAEVWSEPARRAALVQSAARDLELTVELVDARGAVLERSGTCDEVDFRAPVKRGAETLGELRICQVWNVRKNRFGVHPLLVMLVAGFTLWLASAAIARRLALPLQSLARVTEDLGAGNLGSRVRLNPHWPGEFGALAESVNRMAARIERQINDERELLATVSHEIRSPLARVRVALELLREEQGRVAPDAGGLQILQRIEREVSEMDSLVGELLASSRIQFSALEPRLLDARDLALSALERVGLGPELLALPDGDVSCHGDPTLLLRALLNLLENAQRHGGGVTRLAITADDREVRWLVEDGGPGFEAGELARVFQPFVRGQRSNGSSLGLGLALVGRIAAGHCGRAWAENLPRGGARVGLAIPRKPRAAAASG